MRYDEITMEFFETTIVDEYLVRGLTKMLAKLNISSYSFNKFLTLNPVAADAFQNAKAMRADLYVDEMVNIADTDPDAQRARNRIGARQWCASRMKPAEYGERIDVKVETIDMRAVLNDAKSRAFIVATKQLNPSNDAEVLPDINELKPV